MENIREFGMSEAKAALPKRQKESNKGSFGKALIIAGSDAYMGAAHLTLESALRGGAGYVGCLNDSRICDSLLMKYPEAIYHRVSLDDITAALDIARGYSSVVVGPGLGCSERVCRLVEALIVDEGGVLIIDADGLNSISRYSGAAIFKERKREIIITPHPLEFSRLTGVDASVINAERVDAACSFAKEYGVSVLLKGHGTVVTDGERVFVNTSGNSALSKGGTGDVLSGLCVSLAASMPDKTLAAILAAFIHGIAAERESLELSTFGVLPSELPRRIAEVICRIENAGKM